jgi:hypothetical protein
MIAKSECLVNDDGKYQGNISFDQSRYTRDARS